MPVEELSLGCGPRDESLTVQPASPLDRHVAYVECSAWIKEIRAAIGDEPREALLAVHFADSEYRTYLYYDSDVSVEEQYAAKVRAFIRDTKRWSLVGNDHLGRYLAADEKHARNLGMTVIQYREGRW